MHDDRAQFHRQALARLSEMHPLDTRLYAAYRRDDPPGDPVTILG
jgi:hypothetical protein